MIDYWAADHNLLAPAAEKRQDLNFFIVGINESVVRITGTVVYAEFDDGSKVGPDSVEVYSNLRCQRERKLSAFHDLLGMIRSGLPDVELEQYVQTTPGLKWLSLIRAKGGWDGVAAALSKRLNLAP